MTQKATTRLAMQNSLTRTRPTNQSGCLSLMNMLSMSSLTGEFLATIDCDCATLSPAVAASAPLGLMLTPPPDDGDDGCSLQHVTVSTLFSLVFIISDVSSIFDMLALVVLPLLLFVLIVLLLNERRCSCDLNMAE